MVFKFARTALSMVMVKMRALNVVSMLTGAGARSHAAAEARGVPAAVKSVSGSGASQYAAESSSVRAIGAQRPVAPAAVMCADAGHLGIRRSLPPASQLQRSNVDPSTGDRSDSAPAAGSAPLLARPESVSLTDQRNIARLDANPPASAILEEVMDSQ